ncbi:hypothetical protein L7A46_26160, partial [Achromobacter xylosoxidans]|nr:hypothetical protein [Achromobacter xylosoxidans]
MDFPKSVPGVGLVDGRFVNEDPIAGRAGSLIPAEWGNALTNEVLAVVVAGGLNPDEQDHGQLLKAIGFLIGQAVANRPLVYSINALPQENKGPIIVAECSEVWIWVAGAYFTGYRSPLCGRPLDGHTASPLPSEVDAIGGLLSKTDYARLWGYAQEQGLVKTEAVWQANRGAHWFTDYSATQFRVPDLRDMFRRFTGTDADTANARALGSRQADALQRITASFDLRRMANGDSLVGNAGTFGA